MIETFDAVLPHGITLSCRASGPVGAPLLLFVHGFPEAAFVWDDLLEHFGNRYRCIAPNLRGFGPSSAPVDAEAYRVKHLVADLEALVVQLRATGARPLEALIAHDWGGALAWTYAALKPEQIKRLVIINSPHPATFLRELQRNPAQQAASAYMNDLCQPDAERRLVENDFERLWEMFERMGAIDTTREGGGWLTDAVRDRYREIWSAGLTGGCNYYRASPLRPAAKPGDRLMSTTFSAEHVTVTVPTLVIWAEDDLALLTGLVDGLEEYVPQLRLVRVPHASHWIIHERPALVAAEIEREVGR